MPEEIHRLRHVLFWEDFSAEDLYWICRSGWKLIGRDLQEAHYYYASHPHEIVNDELISVIPSSRFMSLKLDSDGRNRTGIERSFERHNKNRKLCFQLDCQVSQEAVLHITIGDGTNQGSTKFQVNSEELCGPDGARTETGRARWVRLTIAVAGGSNAYQAVIGKDKPLSGRVGITAKSLDRLNTFRIVIDGSAGSSALVDNIVVFEADGIGPQKALPANGRQFARNKHGQLLFIQEHWNANNTPDRSQLALHIGTPQFSPTPWQRERRIKLPFPTAPGPLAPAMVKTDEGHLAITYQDGSGIRTWVTIKSTLDNRLEKLTAWRELESSNDRCLLGDLAYGSKGICVAASHANGIFLWRAEDDIRTNLAEGPDFSPPVVHVDDHGTVHAAFCGPQGVMYANDQDGREPRLVLPAGINPAIVGNAKQLIVAALVPSGENVSEGTVQAVRQEDGAWQKPETLSPEGFTSCSLSIDTWNVITLHTSNPDRHWIYKIRWLDHQWSSMQECRGTWSSAATRMEPAKAGPLHWLAQANRVSAEKHAEASASSSAVAIYEDPWSDHVDIHLLPAHRFQASPGRQFLFLDNEELCGANNIDHKLGQTKRFSRPVLSHGNEGQWDSCAASIYGTVLKEQDLLRMWYTGYPRRTEQTNQQRTVSPGGHGLGIGYAESQDGINWKKISLGQWGDTNKIKIKSTNPDDLRWINPNIFLNPYATNVSEKYAMFAEGKSPPGRGKLAFSPDGIHWEAAKPDPERKDSGHNGGFDTPEMEIQSYLLEDTVDAGRELKTYGQPRPKGNIRMQAIGWTSPEKAKHLAPWLGSSGQIVLDPHASLDPGEFQDHRMLVWKQYGYYLGLYEVYNHLEYFVDIRLAVSRDGFNWIRIEPGKAFIPVGRQGWWDGGMLVVSTRPVEHDGQHHLYYAGGSLCQMSPGYKRSNNRNIGVVRFPVDGYAYVTPKESDREAIATTLPLEMASGTPGDLTLNVAGVRTPGAKVEVELLDAENAAVIAGYSRQDHNPILEDGSKVKVSWQDRSVPKTDRAIQVRFYLTGKAIRLFGFGFNP